MTLKSFGCSFIFGTDLSDDVSSDMFDWSEGGIYIRPSKLTWPALLAEHYNYKYVSRALPGIGNLQIFESVLKEIPYSDSNDLFVIQWTWIDRFDYENLCRSDRDNFWSTLLPGNHTQNSNWYFKNIHSQYRDKLTTLTYIKTTLDLLQQNNISFIMTNLDDLVFESEWHTNAAIEYLQNSIRSYITKFNNQNFVNWAINEGFQLSKTQHLLDDAHAAAYNLIKSYNLV